MAFHFLNGEETSTSPNSSKQCSYERTVIRGLSADCRRRGLTDVPPGLPENLDSLRLGWNNIKILTNLSFVSVPNLRNLSLHHNHLATIQRGTFYLLPFLKFIDLSHNMHLSTGSSAGIFSKNPFLHTINFRHDKFTSVPVGLLVHMRSMKEVNILLGHNSVRQLNFSEFPQINVSHIEFKFNNLSKVSTGDFLPLETISIQTFDLSHNNLTVLRDGVFQHLRLASTMRLTFNSIRNLTLNAFIGMESLTELQLTGCRVRFLFGFSENITNMDNGFGIPPLKSLILSYNRINILRPEVFLGLSQLTFLDLRASNIAHLSNASFKGLDSLQNLDLSLNKLYSVNAKLFSQLPNLQKLLLSTNMIQIFSPDQLSGLNSLKYLDLSDNSMREFEEGVWDLPSLDTLDLSNINIELLKTVSLKGLTSLRKLILSSNPIQYLGYDTFTSIGNIKNIDLSWLGQLSDLSKPFISSSSLLSLNLSHSKLGNIQRAFQGLTSLQVLKLSDCTLNGEKLYRDNVSAFSLTPNLTYLSLRGNSLSGLYPETFLGLVHMKTLDLSKSGLLSIDRNLFRNLISLKELYLDQNTIFSISADHFRYLHSLIGIRLQRNQIKGVLDKELFRNNTNLNWVALSKNAITGIARDTWLPMKTLDVSENPFSCVCDLQWFRNHLAISNLTLNNANKTICSSESLSEFVGKSILEFDPQMACGVNVLVYICSSLLILSLIFGITLAYRYRWWLNYKCFHIKLFIVGFYELEDGREHLDYDYDIDVIFPDRDEAWAKEEFIGALIEHVPQFDRERLVCGEDDLPLGGVRMDAIDYVIENSFKIVVIVSNASVTDAHFLTQLQMAVEHMNEVQLEKVVIVFREDIPDNQLPYLVRLFLSKNKPYFRWTDDEYGQRLFWEKLVKVLRANKKMNGLLPI